MGAKVGAYVIYEELYESEGKEEQEGGKYAKWRYVCEVET
jgi:hypothetical protein